MGKGEPEGEGEREIRYNLATFAMMYDICFDFGFGFWTAARTWLLAVAQIPGYLKWMWLLL